MRIRHDAFDRLCDGLDVEVWHAYSAKDAIQRLRNVARFNCAFLDHDLERGDAEDGWVVAEYIALHMDRGQQPLNVVIHSWNHNGARNMENILRDHGYTNVKCVQFSHEGKL